MLKQKFTLKIYPDVVKDAESSLFYDFQNPSTSGPNLWKIEDLKKYKRVVQANGTEPICWTANTAIKYSAPLPGIINRLSKHGYGNRGILLRPPKAIIIAGNYILGDYVDEFDEGRYGRIFTDEMKKKLDELGIDIFHIQAWNDSFIIGGIPIKEMELNQTTFAFDFSTVTPVGPNLHPFYRQFPTKLPDFDGGDVLVIFDNFASGSLSYMTVNMSWDSLSPVRVFYEPWQDSIDNDIEIANQGILKFNKYKNYIIGFNTSELETTQTRHEILHNIMSSLDENNYILDLFIEEDHFSPTEDEISILIENIQDEIKQFFDFEL